MPRWAKVPPYRPDFETIPIALVASIHLLGVREKLFTPARFLIPSNSMELKLGFQTFHLS